jgi:hypothetical protein
MLTSAGGVLLIGVLRVPVFLGVLVGFLRARAATGPVSASPSSVSATSTVFCPSLGRAAIAQSDESSLFFPNNTRFIVAGSMMSPASVSLLGPFMKATEASSPCAAPNIALIWLELAPCAVDAKSLVRVALVLSTSLTWMTPLGMPTDASRQTPRSFFSLWTQICSSFLSYGSGTSRSYTSFGQKNAEDLAGLNARLL